MTSSQHRRFYNKFHADDPRHFDLTAVCLLVGVGGFAGLLMALVVRALMGGWW